jgi:hypothetical protein
MPNIVAERPFQANLGPATATGFLFIADPAQDSFVRGVLNVLGLEDVTFEARVDGPPIQITVLNVKIVIKFDADLRSFIGTAHQVSCVRHPQASIVALD